MSKIADARRSGRPPKDLVDSEVADIVRLAVRAFSRYWGIRIQDIGSGRKRSWIQEAMKAGPMTIDTAWDLLREIVHPSPELVGKKRPKGMSFQRLNKLIAAGAKRGIDPSHWGRKLYADAAMQYQSSALFALLRVLPYKFPFPGIAMFILPGTSNPVARHVTDLVMSAAGLSKQRARDLLSAMRQFLKPAEAPFAQDAWSEVVPRLHYAALSHYLRMATDLMSRFPLSDQENASIEDLFATGLRSAERRESAKWKRIAN